MYVPAWDVFYTLRRTFSKLHKRIKFKCLRLKFWIEGTLLAGQSGAQSIAAMGDSLCPTGPDNPRQCTHIHFKKN
jgi:hypothetical protein